MGPWGWAIPSLKPVFETEGTVTAANSSSISDGAAAFVLCSEEYSNKFDVPIKARIKGYAGHAQEPGWFTTAPIPAAKKLIDRLLNERAAARSNKDFEKADQIRQEIESLGVSIEDGPDGPIWKKQ